MFTGDEKCHVTWPEGHSRSSNLSPVEGIFDFLLVVNCKLGRIFSHDFRATVTYCSKIASGACPSHSTPAL